MTKFLFWSGNVFMVLSIVLPFVHPVMAACSAFLGLTLSVISSIRSEHEHSKQLEQERQEREYQVYRNSEQGQVDMIFDRISKPYGKNPRRSSAWRSKV